MKELETLYSLDAERLFSTKSVYVYGSVQVRHSKKRAEIYGVTNLKK